MKSFKNFLNEEKPPRTEHSWPTRRNKTGGWHWANSFGGGHESSEASDRHYVVSQKKLKGEKVDLADLKPGDRKPTKPVGFGKGRW